jgi:hypothetical protein
MMRQVKSLTALTITDNLMIYNDETGLLQTNRRPQSKLGIQTET